MPVGKSAGGVSWSWSRPFAPCHWISVAPHVVSWVRLGLPALCNLAGPIQHEKSAILDAWKDRVAASLCARKGSEVVRFLMLLVPCSLFGRDKALLICVLVGGVRNGYLFGEGARSACSVPVLWLC